MGTPSSAELSLSQTALAAAKVLVGPLARRVSDKVGQGTRRTSSGGFAVDLVEGSFSFTRAWIQGVVVSSNSGVVSFVVDDGTGALTVDARAVAKQLLRKKVKFSPPREGSYVQVIGAVVPPGESVEKLTLKAHKVIAVDDPNREALWHAETLQLYREVYSV
ncbi:RecQ-mediated genome instability protein 2 [Chloropicon primus]|uniref:OB domain-containing protein n=1 Tax=Chloropicon primus TaxID=1764295 RepID=A0A5B8MIY2_9CHLO|nr:hypothetical protein A3770_03p21430 [Chloropicon primus]UPQ98837.1 RecQ-mediated genome instability protein 2 [Chloropicon primus]|eukprot:QDZ19625.1 hypothetical protein A3770_03p21430 [Chloropicon primus]